MRYPLYAGGVDIADQIAFLNARLDEDEAAAKAATDGPWYADGSEIRGHDRAYAGGEPDILVVMHTWPQESAHIVRHDPARVLREIEADRDLIAAYLACKAQLGSGDDTRWRAGQVDTLCDTIQRRAEIWSDHPDCPVTKEG